MERSEGSTPVVCDAGPLIHLDPLDCLDLLADLGRILVPETVWAEEVERHRPGALRHEGVLIDRERVEPACRIEVVLLRPRALPHSDHPVRILHRRGELLPRHPSSHSLHLHRGSQAKPSLARIPQPQRSPGLLQL
jgi:hypothetical protein